MEVAAHRSDPQMEPSEATPTVAATVESQALLLPGTDPSPDNADVAPPDSWNLSFFIFCWLGTGLLLPWNAFITAIDYFSMLYPTAHIGTVFPMAYMLPELCLLTLLLLYGRKDGSHARIFFGFVCFLALVLSVPLLDLVFVRSNSSSSGSSTMTGTAVSLLLTVAAVAAAGAIDAVVQGSLFGIAGELCEGYVQALVAGTSASGIVVSALRILTKALLPSSPLGLRLSAVLYFAVAALFLACSIAGFRLLHSLPIVQYHARKQGERKSAAARRLDTQRHEGNEDRTALDGGDAATILTSADLGADKLEIGARTGAEGVGQKAPLINRSRSFYFHNLWHSLGHYETPGYMDEEEDEKHDQRDTYNIRPVLLRLKTCVIGICFVYVVTLSIFPGFISDLHSERYGDWYPIILITTFNVFDLVGKLAPTWYQVTSVELLTTLSFARVVFYPLFAMSVGNKWAAHQEWVFVLLTSAFGLSNGALTSWLMMLAPSLVDTTEVETAGIVMVLFLNVGLFLGSWTAGLWVLL